MSKNVVFKRVFGVLTTLVNKAKFTSSRSKSSKGQKILERNCGCLQFSQITNETFSLISTLACKKWLNKKLMAHNYLK